MPDAFFQLLEYPVIGASNMSKKFLYHDKSMLYAIQGRLSTKNYRDSMILAYENIQKSTIYYNTTLSKGKWAGMMSADPRKLPVYALTKNKLEIVPQKTSWNMSVEGDADFNTDTLVAPIFYGKADEQYFIDIFLQKDIKLYWELSSNAKWIKLFKNQGSLNTTQNQFRIWIKPDLNQLPSTNKTTFINIKTNQGNKVVRLSYQKQEELGSDVFKEQNGYLSIFASNYSEKLSDKWQLVDGLGYSGKVISSGNILLANQDHLVLGYQFYNSTSANAKVSVFTVPTHPLNNKVKLRYIIRIDKGE